MLGTSTRYLSRIESIGGMFSQGTRSPARVEVAQSTIFMQLALSFVDALRLSGSALSGAGVSMH